ncbi:MAG: sulfatase-like hydrolase/transferase [Planctomycetes bacterium]|nr:sulfatase-like hydrolase/transferase [Planctomycetota bacterium]
MSNQPHHAPTNWSSTLRRALVAGMVVGAAFGLVDALIAARIGTADLTVTSFLGCVAGAVFEYVLVWSAGLFVASIVARPVISRRDGEAQTLAFVRIALLCGLFLELYWWSRPYLFPGWNSLSIARILVTIGIALVALVLAFVSARPVVNVLRRAGPALVVLVLLIAGSGAGYLALHRGSVGSLGEKNARSETVPNVLLIVVDALRADTLGCYGHPRVKSPFIDALAAEGVLFENAFTQAPFTWTSFGSFLTGKYPRRHGLVKMAPGVAMSRENVTLPYHLKRACFDDEARKGTCLERSDYLGATFHTGTLSTGTGLLRGFDVYYEQMAGHGIVVVDSAWSVFRSDLLLHLIVDKTRAKVGTGVPRVSKDWLTRFGDRRFMAMVHLYSTHTPYDPEPQYRDMYVDPKYTGRFKSFYASDREGIESGKYTTDAADVAQIQNLYYAGVTQDDAKIGALLQVLKDRGVLDDTIVIVMSDHGESLGEGGLWEHNHMVQTNLRIPLVVRWPKGLPAGTRVQALVDEIDLVPTLCDLMGIEVPHEPGERGMVDGVSLMPLIRKEVEAVRKYSYAENGIWIGIQDLRWKLVVPAELLPPGEWPKQKTPYGEVPWLVDLLNDPDETKNLLEKEPAEVERLLKALREFDASMPIPKSVEVLSDRDREQQSRNFKALGYTGEGIGGARHPKPAQGQ